MKENQIIKLIQKPSSREEGFKQIVDLYQERLYWHIRKMVLSHDDADDVLQNTFIKVWKSLDNFRGDSKIYTWLYRIATNESLNHIQTQKKKFTSSLGNVDEEYLHLKLTSDPYFDGDEAEKKLWMAVETLPQKQKTVFKLKYFDNMKYEDMSDVLKTSVGALKASYHHAVNKIKEYLTKELNY